MLLSNTIWFARSPQAANELLQGIGLGPDDPPLMAITPIMPEQCLSALAPMRYAMFDFGLIPEDVDPPPFVITLSQVLARTCVIETAVPGVVESFLLHQRITAPETLVMYGADFDPDIIPIGMPTINLLVVARHTLAVRSLRLLELWKRSTLVVPYDRLDDFATEMARSRL